MSIAIGCQQEAQAESQHHEGQGRDVEFLDSGDKGDQQESASLERLLSVQSGEVGEQRAAGYGDRKDGGRYSNAVSIEQPVGQRSKCKNDCCFGGKGAFLSGAEIRRRRGEIDHYCVTCLDWKIANHCRRGALA
nr:hypothetical protein [Bradyrhizobium icense]